MPKQGALCQACPNGADAGARRFCRRLDFLQTATRRGGSPRHLVHQHGAGNAAPAHQQLGLDGAVVCSSRQAAGAQADKIEPASAALGNSMDASMEASMEAEH